MSKLQPVRGTRDIFGEQARAMAHVADTFKALAQAYGFEEMAPPIFEFTEVFKRTLGDTSDVVTKEMYTFEDRSGDSLTLRPELTASIARAWMSNGLASQGVSRLYGLGPMFRHERPQKGRYRQFHQIDAEIIGASEPDADLDLLAFAHQLLDQLGIVDACVLHLNTLGDAQSRLAYRASLIDYFSAHEHALSEDSRARLNRNPLRILDSKDKGDQAIVADAPRLSACLNQASQSFFDTVRRGLNRLAIPYVYDERLVRGLDYYSHTAFEFVTEALGAQGTVLGGGRYDGLMEQMGGPATPGVGWAGGMERLALMLAAPPKPLRPATLIPLGATAEDKALQLAYELRGFGLSLLMDYKGNLKKRLARANKVDARFAILLGEEELAKGQASVRDLDTGDQEAVALDALANYLKQK